MLNKLKDKTLLSTKQIKRLYNIVRIIGIDELDKIPKMLNKKRILVLMEKRSRKPDRIDEILKRLTNLEKMVYKIIKKNHLKV